ncbi:glycosyltransferase family 28 C-terminal domain-containing protein [Scheffersomyces amazonensis]|uniref:glycosyltransferase family 28 C-terminal domain-containing protein n=1 Tax=Scheffersomyces amazonensis TaxID=1078765 RepID=UPI00315D4501
MTAKTLLVTTGATVTFKALVINVLKQEFLSGAVKLGFKTVIIQYGNEIKDNVHVSEKFVEETLTNSDLFNRLNLKPISSNSDTFPKEKQLKIYSNSDFELLLLPFSNNINYYVNKADLVISHAGTGSIIDALRSSKKLLVVINDTLMDNHQTEVAAEFCRQNYCGSLGSKDITDSRIFLDAIQRQLVNSNTEFVTDTSNIIQSIIYEELVSL